MDCVLSLPSQSTSSFFPSWPQNLALAHKLWKKLQPGPGEYVLTTRQASLMTAINKCVPLFKKKSPPPSPSLTHSRESVFSHGSAFPIEHMHVSVCTLVCVCMCLCVQMYEMCHSFGVGSLGTQTQTRGSHQAVREYVLTYWRSRSTRGAGNGRGL